MMLNSDLNRLTMISSYVGIAQKLFVHGSVCCAIASEGVQEMIITIQRKTKFREISNILC